MVVPRHEQYGTNAVCQLVLVIALGVLVFWMHNQAEADLTAVRNQAEVDLNAVMASNEAKLTKLQAKLQLSEKSWGGFHLAPAGATSCDWGSAVTQGECDPAVSWLAAQKQYKTGSSLVVGAGGTCENSGWGSMPLGCSYYCNDGTYQL